MRKGRIVDKMYIFQAMSVFFDIATVYRRTIMTMEHKKSPLSVTKKRA